MKEIKIETVNPGTEREYKRLATPIAEAVRAYPSNPRRGMAADGYTTRSGAPTSVMVRLEGEKRFRRVMVWQFSNAGTCFLRIRGESVIVSDCDIPEVRS